MTIQNLKFALEKPLKIFTISICCTLLISVYCIYFGTDKWLLGLTPSILVFSLIGAAIIAKTLVYLSGLEMNVETEELRQMNESDFDGMKGVQSFLYLSVILIYVTTFIICSIYNYFLFDFVIMNIFFSLLVIAVTIIALYFVLNYLSFTIFFITMIYSWTAGYKARRASSKINDMKLNENYDIEGNIKKLILRYTDRISWLESHTSSENQSEYKARIIQYQTTINDLQDFLYNIDI